MPTTYTWIGTTTSAFATSTNWLPNGNPATGDSLIFDGRATQAIAGSDQSAITVASITVTNGHPYAIASSTTKLKIGCTLAVIGTTPGDGSTGAGAEAYFDFTTIANTTIVRNSKAQGTSGIEPVQIIGANAANALYVTGGLVGLATNGGESATYPTVSATGGVLNCGPGCTLTTVTNDGSLRLLVNGAATTLLSEAGTTFIQGTALVATVNLVGGVVEADHRVAAGGNCFTTLNLRGGTLNLRNDPRAFPVGTINFRKGKILAFSPTQFTATTTALDWDVNTQIGVDAS